MHGRLQRIGTELDGWTSPFTAPVPEHLRAQTLILQAERLRAFLPMLCLLIAANALAMALAVLGDLPWWQQLAPPAIIIGTCLAVLYIRRGHGPVTAPGQAARLLHRTLPVAATLGAVAGIWCVNAFTETEQYYCMVAPVFIGIAALMSSTCLISAPRAAIAAMATTVTPIVIKMMLYDNLGVRAMAAMMVLVTMMQAGVVLAKFRETVRMLGYQHELDRIAVTDPMTGLQNRLAFDRELEARLSAEDRVVLALADLDGFKQVNDRYGHLAGDEILRTIARRLQVVAPSALSIARLGGDEFALLFATSPSGGIPVACDPEAFRAAITQPVPFHGHQLTVGCSFGIAANPADGRTPDELVHSADNRLYSDKNTRKAA
ncbi:sensor domain-containing diguanylate cyclase [Novosphingobium mangrovi (ex Huang et al. 2023)]|uniref:diguanylate cyclase n=1 Tax=Novosphingobium mangrovi (ex Huang et al. 2023) TaxID=2976432 RepID=A0ABT2I9C6_9SPHN|nr:diguanylate cyclase [Novosphingobium mangrovi (ex Huang et al. 2023)]MCT2401112.1 diguanylate cyclase [Novosphingobium mangrovi (ex Huang et al. 2023)]